MKWIDLPPVWLFGFAVVIWQLRGIGGFDVSGLAMFGTGLVAGAVVLMGLAALELRKQHTTVIPHMQPTALVSSGPFARSRNPIYLADAIVLVGLSLRWGAPLGLLLVPAFVWVIQTRFIIPEEARLAAKFGPAFDAYCAQTRRWL